jgi:hypothetical protein
MSNYLVETIPVEAMKFLALLNAVSDAAWAMYAKGREKGNNDKLEVDALRLAKDTAIEIIDIVTNNHSFVDAAFEAAAAHDQESKEQRQRKV